MPLKNSQELFVDGDRDQKPLFSFGIIADVQYADQEPAGTRHYRASAGKLRSALASLNKDSVSFIINLGDLIDKDYSSYKPVMNIIESAGIKMFHVAGNHDYAVEKRYKKRLPVLVPSKDAYYSFIVQQFRFIVLNGNDISTYISNNKERISQAEKLITSMKAKGESNAVEWNGGIGTKQMSWLAGQLDDAKSKNERVIIMCHFPVVPDNVHNLLNYKEVLSLLQKHQHVIAWFNGHNHAGNYGNFNMIHFITIKGMVETETTTSFALVEIYRNKIWIKGQGREKSQILAY